MEPDTCTAPAAGSGFTPELQPVPVLRGGSPGHGSEKAQSVDQTPPHRSLSCPSLPVLRLWQQMSTQYFPGLWPGHLLCSYPDKSFSITIFCSPAEMLLPALGVDAV